MKSIIIAVIAALVLVGLILGGWYIKTNTTLLDPVWKLFGSGEQDQNVENDGDNQTTTRSYNFLLEDSPNADEVEFFKANITKRVTAFGVVENSVEIDDNSLTIDLTVPEGQEFVEDDFIGVMVNTPTFEIKKENDPELVVLSDEEKAQIKQDNLDIQEKAEGVLQQVLDNPESFADLAAEHSEDPGSKDTGGAYTQVKKGNFVAEYDDVIFNQLEVGETYPELVATDFGWHIIKKDNETGEGDERLIDTSHILFRKKTEENALATKQWSNTKISGIYIKDAVPVAGAQEGTFAVQISLNETGTQLFKELTADNIGKQVAIFLNGGSLGEPTVEQEIETGQLLLGGDYTQQDTQFLLAMLNNGVVDTRITLVE